MVTDKLRKNVLPNIPYVFIGWVFLKLGTAYRLAAGGDFAHKLLGLGQTVGAAFADFAPFDWLVGIVGAVAFRLLIYFKSKNAKKFRRGAEYGSARWGDEKDIKPFVDPKLENNMLLTATERLTMNTRPKNPANARNLNFCGIGSSGSGKTRFWLTLQLLQAHSSYAKTRDIYTAYRKAGHSRKYHDAHESDIIIHKAAKKALDDLALKKLPTVKSLQAEYSDLLVQKKLDYAELSKARDEAKQLHIYKANAEMLLRTDAEEQRQTREHQQEK